MSAEVYAVGLLRDLRRRRIGWWYMRHQIKAHNWRAVRNYFRNGWLTEHQWPCSHNAGWGWTKRASARRADRACTEARP